MGVLETEIELTYDQTKSIRRRLEIPLSRNDIFNDALDSEIYDEAELGKIEFDEVDQQFRETKREPDTDDMVVTLEIEQEEVKQSSVGSLLKDVQSNSSTLFFMIVFIGAIGFVFGYVQNQGKHYQTIPNDRDETLLVEMQ